MVSFTSTYLACSLVDVSLQSFLFTHIDIVALTTDIDFLHRALLFVFMRHEAALCLQQTSQ